MTTQVQLRRGTAAEHTTFTGATGEVTVDTTDDRVVVHDGVTAGGFPMAKESEIPTRASLGLATSDSPQFAGVNIGTATDTTITRVSAGVIAVEGVTILTTATGQPLDADLTAIAALTTTAAGRSVLDFVDPNADRVLIWDDSAGDFVGATLTSNLEINGTTIRAIETHIIAASDETTTITTGTNKATFALPYAFTVTAVGASVNTVSSSGTPTIDINEAGVTILSTKITIDASEKTSLTAAVAAVISDASIAAGAEIGIDIDVAGTGAKGLKVWIRGYPT